MKKDKLYLFTVLAITVVFLIISVVGVQYFIKVSANQLIEVQVETSKREANEIAGILNFQLKTDHDKKAILKNFQQIISKSSSDTWFISIFDWSGKKICHPDITKIGEAVNSKPNLLASLKEKNNSENLHDLLVSNSAIRKNEKAISEVIHIAPVQSSDLIVAANVNINNIHKQLKRLRRNFYMIFLIMGILVIVLSSAAVRIIGSSYEKQLEMKNSNLANEVINLSRLNTDLISYQEKKEKETNEVAVTSGKINEASENNKIRILTYIRNELVPVLISDIAYIYTENTITYIVCFDGKKSTSNSSLDEIHSNLDETLFFRANRQFIISISAINKIIKYGKSQLKILLKAKISEEILISKNKAAEFKQWLSM